MLGPVSISRECGWTVELFHCAIQRTMRLAQLRRHQIDIVKIAKRGIRKAASGVEHGLREATDFSPLLVRDLWPGEGVVHDSNGIAVVAFQASADLAQPCHVHGRGENAKMPQVGIEQDAD